MTIYKWNPEKNETLMEERGVGFQDLIAALENNKILAVLNNPSRMNQKKYF